MMMGATNMVDYLLRQGVRPDGDYYNNVFVEGAAALGRIGVIKRLLADDRVNGIYYYHGGTGVAPVHAALTSIEERQRMYGLGARVADHWAVVEALVRKGNGQCLKVGVGNPRTVITAPRPLFDLIAAMEPEYMAEAAPEMLGRLMAEPHWWKPANDASADNGDWQHRMTVVRGCLKPSHPFAEQV